MDRAPAVHRALSTVLHPDRLTGSAELQQQLNDGRRQVEERQADMQLPPDPPGTQYMGGHCEEAFVPAVAADFVTRLAQKANVPITEVIRLAKARALDILFGPDGKLIVWGPGEYPVEHRGDTRPRTECRNISGAEARRITERYYRPGSTLGWTAAERMSTVEKQNMVFDMRYAPGEFDPRIGTMTPADRSRMLDAMKVGPTRRRSGAEAQRLTEAMRYPRSGSSRRRSWREAMALTLEAYRPGHVRF
jgi:hypothetical protein